MIVDLDAFSVGFLLCAFALGLGVVLRFIVDSYVD